MRNNRFHSDRVNFCCVFTTGKVMKKCEEAFKWTYKIVFKKKEKKDREEKIIHHSWTSKKESTRE